MKTPVTYSHSSPLLRATKMSIHADEVGLCRSGSLGTTCAWTTSLSNPLYGRNIKSLCKATRFDASAVLLVPFHLTRPVNSKVLRFSVAWNVFCEYKRREVTRGRIKLHNVELHTFHPCHTSLGWLEKEDEMGGACGTQEVLVGKHDVLGTSRRCEDNIKWRHRMGWRGMDSAGWG
jgi:hypothetical protein